MGQAKRRGTLEDRIVEARIRDAALPPPPPPPPPEITSRREKQLLEALLYEKLFKGKQP